LKMAGRLHGREGKREGGGVRPWERHTAWDGVVGSGPDRVPARRDPDAACTGGASLF
jgi:hypothetical protein